MLGRVSLWIGVALALAPAMSGQQVHHFDRVAQFKIAGAVAEITAATPDGRTLIYASSQAGRSA